MSLLRVENNTPETYCNRSRDFQLLCRLYTCVVNDTKFNIDSMLELVNTHLCRSDILQLLQTKLGFFSDKYITDDELRIILEAFPLMVKNKGSLKSIKQAINVFLKCKNINSNVEVFYTNKETVIRGMNVDAHSLVIGIESYLQDITILKEIFKYILPVGVGYYFYFFSSSEMKLDLQLTDVTKLFVVSNNLNSALRTASQNDNFYSDLEYPEDNFNHLIGGVDTVQLVSDDSEFAVSEHYVLTYVGKYDSINDITNVFEGATALVKTDIGFSEYIFVNSNWQEIKFRGNYLSVSDVDTPQYFDVVAINNSGYKLFDGAQFVECSVYTEKPLNPVENDIFHDLVSDEYYIYSGSWESISFNGSYHTTTNISSPYDGLYKIDGVSYYLYDNTQWVECTYAIYQLEYYKGE